VERYLTVRPSAEDKRLDAARKVVDAIWDEHEAILYGDLAAAGAVLSPALQLEPDNMYLRFLERKERALAAEAAARP
jgi:hypothetical protein